MTPPKRKVPIFFKVMSVVQTVFLTVFLVIPPQVVQAQTFNVLDLPKPGSLVGVSESFVPVLIKGISLHPENPLVFDFIVDPGNTGFGDDQIRKEGERLIKYFLAALTVPEKDLWVNLSPDEADRIIPTAFGQTEMGRDLLAQDYILKQISASMIYPEKDLGRDFWGRVYAKAKEVYGTVKIPVSTFNKVWIVPDKAIILENEQTAFVASGHLKVMLEEDYAALNENRAEEILGNNRLKHQDIKKLNSISSSVVREIILPEIEKEVNEGKNFAQLRQIYYSLVLAAWFKNNLKDNILTQVYADQQKISGVDVENKNDKDKIYERYMEAYREGVFNYIREDVDSTTQEMIPRKYFSGGFDGTEAFRNTSSFPAREFTQLVNTGVVQASSVVPVSPNDTFRTLTTGLNRTTGEYGLRDASMNALSKDALFELTRPAEMELGMFDNRPVVVKSSLANDARLPVVLARVSDQIQSPAERDQITTILIAPNETNIQQPVIMDRQTLVVPVALLEKPETIQRPTNVTRDELVEIVSKSTESPAVRELSQQRVIEVVTLTNNQQVVIQPRGERTDAVRAVVETVLPQMPVPVSNIKKVEVAPSSMQLPSPVVVSGDTLLITPEAVRNPALVKAPVVQSPQQIFNRGTTPSPISQRPEVAVLRLAEFKQPVIVQTQRATMPEIEVALKAALPVIPEALRGQITDVQVVPSGSMVQPVVLTQNGSLILSREAVDNPEIIRAVQPITSYTDVAQVMTPSVKAMENPAEIQVTDVKGFERPLVIQATQQDIPQISKALEVASSFIPTNQRGLITNVQRASAGSVTQPMTLTDDGSLILSNEAIENPQIITTQPTVTKREVLAQASPTARELALPNLYDVTTYNQRPIAIQVPTSSNRLQIEAAFRVIVPTMVVPEQVDSIKEIRVAPRGAQLSVPAITKDGTLVLPMAFVERPDAPESPKLISRQQMESDISLTRTIAERPTFQVVEMDDRQTFAVEAPKSIAMPQAKEALRVALTQMLPAQQSAIKAVQVAPVKQPVSMTEDNILVISQEAVTNPKIITTAPVKISRADLARDDTTNSQQLAQPREVYVVTVNERPVAVESPEANLPQIRTMLGEIMPKLSPDRQKALTSVQLVSPEIKLPESMVSTDQGKTWLVSPAALNNPELLARVPVEVERQQLTPKAGNNIENALVKPSQTAIVKISDQKTLPVDLADADAKQVEAMVMKVADEIKNPDVLKAITAVHVVQPGVKLQQPVITDSGRTLMLPRPLFNSFDMVKVKPIVATRDELVKIASSNLGGIDFNPDMIKMEINKENGGIKVKFDPKILEEIRTQGIEGFVPVILNVQPLKTALPLLTKGSVVEEPIQLSKL